MKTKTMVFAVLAVTAAVFAWPRPRNIPPSDLRDAVAGGGDLDTGMPALENGGDNFPEPALAAAEGVPGSYAETNVPPAGEASGPIAWIRIKGGMFEMGTDGDEKGFKNAGPGHEVFVEAFEMSKTEVTVEQYAACVLKGRCKEPVPFGYYCNWWKTGRRTHPINCVNWDQAQAFARFMDDVEPGYRHRLPSEAEWEYAASSGGKNREYPWGGTKPGCDKVVMATDRGDGCGVNATMPGCSKPEGNTAWGLCDMAGNVWEWAQDSYRDSYAGAPANGGAVELAGAARVVRGGSFVNFHDRVMRIHARYGVASGEGGGHIGFRLARSGW